jgi:hypothetical protein
VADSNNERRQGDLLDKSSIQPAGFKWPVAAEQPIAAPAIAVWEAISAPGNLERCHPFCKSNPVHVWPGPDSHDEIHYLSGWVYERHFKSWIEGVGYDLEIGGHREKRSFVTWRVEPVKPTSSTLTITIYPHVLQGVPAALRWLPYAAYVRPMLRRYLASVLGGFEWYVTRGEAVPRNQFGGHPWFSKRRRRGARS